MESRTDEMLMKDIQAGNQQAFQYLVNQNLASLHGFAQRMLGSNSDAEDVVQETFLRVWNKAHTWKAGKAKLSTWLHRITHNLCVDWQRKPKVQTVTLDQDVAENTEHSTDSLQREETAQLVERALQRLPERQRSAIVLCYYQGMSNRDAAQVLNVSVAALESLLARGRRSLKTLLSEQGLS
ncbi:RNA polymerase sigma factor [Candidatus Albibeggiatoa sp. nov. NOAA]|uniref:RNA polymerase sigma factor n=1 Tax=Candidatus Albibeggiatoa sp. nov. NOAA TaxID=3162724 RepID=UPI0032F5BC6C|nr:RNA polymerase sigma factor [Thiotrichaceae bacterium]